MMDYIIERIDCLDEDVKRFLLKEIPKLEALFDDKFKLKNCALEVMIQKGVFFICRRHGEVTGLHLSWLTPSTLDVTVNILSQQLFYVKPDSGRTAYHLFKKFIDFGRTHADHINTMVGRHTNIKASTLKRWGFKELEVMYRMEIVK